MGLPTLLESFMLLSVKLRLRLTQLSSMELMAMLVWDTLDMLDTLDILILMDMLVILMPLVDMPVLDVMLPTLLELFMLPKNFKFEVVFAGSSPYLNIFQFL